MEDITFVQKFSEKPLPDKARIKEHLNDIAEDAYKGVDDIQNLYMQNVSPLGVDRDHCLDAFANVTRAIEDMIDPAIDTLHYQENTKWFQSIKDRVQESEQTLTTVAIKYGKEPFSGFVELAPGCKDFDSLWGLFKDTAKQAYKNQITTSSQGPWPFSNGGRQTGVAA